MKRPKLLFYELQSSKPERIFSGAGRLITQLRSRLDAERVKDQLMIKLNIELLREVERKKKNME